MNKEYIKGLCQNIIKFKKYEYFNINMIENSGVKTLRKDSFGSIKVIEIINGDELCSDEISDKFKKSEEMLYKLQMAEQHYIIKIFVFDKLPSKEKLSLVIDNQIHRPLQKKYIKCISIIRDEEKIIKHYINPISYFGLKNVLKRQFQSTYYTISNEEITTIVKNKGEGLLGNRKHKNAKVTYALIGANIFIWILAQIYGFKSGNNVSELLFAFGSRDNPSIISGEYLRIVKAIFLHIDTTHLLVNSYILYTVGPIVEKVYGQFKFLGIYIVSGIIGNVCGFAFSFVPGVGASGAIFGLIGAILYIGIEKHLLFKTCFGKNTIFVVAVSLGIGFLIPGTDNYAHFGGLIGGFLAAGISKIDYEKRWYYKRSIFVIATVILVLSIFNYGFVSDNNKALTNIGIIKENLIKANIEETGVEDYLRKIEIAANKVLQLEIKNEVFNSIATQALIEVELFEEALENGEVLKE